MKRGIPAAYSFVFIALLLTCIGLVGIYSSSSVFALERHGSANFFLTKQLSGLALGIIAALMWAVLPSLLLQRLTPCLYVISLLFTLATLIPGLGINIHGSRRWINIGFFAFQPSEVLKLATILYGAFLLDRHELKLSSFTRGLLPIICITLVACGTLLLQPDFGQAVALATTMICMAFVAGVRWQHMAALIMPLIPVVTLLVVLKPYRFKRVLTFLNPWSDPQGAGFQIIQSLIAIGSGGTAGVGIAQSKQKFFYLPMQHTDFIFSILAEETGFIGSCCILLLYMALLYCGIRIARQKKTTYAYLVVVGCITLLTFQAIVNMCVVTGLLPTKGIGLPFISYGKSALIVDWLMVGVMLAV